MAEITKNTGVPSLVEIVRDARSALDRADTGARLLVADSFLAGPSSFIRSEGGREQLLDRLLKDVRPDYLPLAHHLADTLLTAHGRSDSLALAYVMCQRGEGPDGKMSEGAILNNLFDAYGVPGIKFKQYLAFTSDFAQFRSAFESSQDSAMPLSYYEALRLVQNRFGDEWTKDLTIDKIMGSGSVNVAIRYTDSETGERRVMSVARENVDTTSEYDFQRFDRFLSELVKTPEDKEKYGYLCGLSNVIHDSVALEFDKKAAYDIQKQVQPLYHREVNGWTVKTVDALAVNHNTVFMEEAKGETARRVRSKDPDTYREALSALCQVEMDVLLGIDEKGKARPVPLHANPDFHDGQVLIDAKNKTVTLLDFGQAVPISNKERDYALDLLGIIGKAGSSEKAAEIVNDHIREQGAPPVTEEEMASVMNYPESMDVFVRLIGLLKDRGADVPLPTVHWILAANRQKALGQTIDIPVEKMLRNVVVTRRLGGSLGLYNMAHLGMQHVQAASRSIVAGPIGAVLGNVFGRLTGQA